MERERGRGAETGPSTNGPRQKGLTFFTTGPQIGRVEVLRSFRNNRDGKIRFLAALTILEGV